MNKLLLTLLSIGILSLGATIGFAQEKEKKGKKAKAATTAGARPTTLIHVVTVAWKEGTTPAQIQAALEGAQKLTQTFPGILRVWTKTHSAQGDRTHAIVMEFKDAQALKEYAGSAAQKEWYEVYLNIRGSSTTFDITN